VADVMVSTSTDRHVHVGARLVGAPRFP
jgi:hypothetical protein